MSPFPLASIPKNAGVGLRYRHHEEVIEGGGRAAWWEVHPENYLSGAPLAWLERIRADRPICLHATGLSLGSADGLDEHHLDRLAALCRRIEPGLVSDHLSFSKVGDAYLGDLLPLPMTEDSLLVLTANVGKVQDKIGHQILVENPSTYLAYNYSPIPEPEFLAELARRSGCQILLDINNIAVSGANLGFDPVGYLEAIPPSLVGEYHLAGHRIDVIEGYQIRIDDHGSVVSDEVWALFARALSLIGRRPALIEWDTQVPPLAVLLAEAAKADALMDASGAEEEKPYARFG
jgi:uncharacterized protein (UPF0276 family)